MEPFLKQYSNIELQIEVIDNKLQIIIIDADVQMIEQKLTKNEVIELITKLQEFHNRM
jgi:KaiC/GvpD/RAD55 family RecA-like ATPase